ncbi:MULTISPECIES: hypothetical protein [Streptomyces]|uniref:Uncharacterized protein n=1 Tax=Streptomyces rimosus subsp. rimosus (strain ATCC 10970 / DSM 40260 / JCM 4667 / NRRL 2234) TaxID=1265868 RepID=A0A8A1UXH6_STRR1|nr:MULTISPECIES: hypothetical protein [Streptomyces]MYT41794.1 hypothetical protein [Streptomyces sp. SID5471]QGY68698.1 hypothetical protein V519_024770 [Streptomyces rimosus R6-500]QST85107.1 hypothetical protein SRIM_037685 [Streptomyces rimosus subsp. rimosus ATCC 10970]QTL84954.1 hypothetical protein FMM49_03425 [Streptomyces rimosus subsp. rimosus]
MGTTTDKRVTATVRTGLPIRCLLAFAILADALPVLADQQAARVGPAAIGREPLAAQADGPALRASRWPRIRSRAARSIAICAGRSPKTLVWV